MKKLYPGQRVDFEAFLKIWMGIKQHTGFDSASMQEFFQTPFGQFLKDVFDVATGMMANKPDVRAPDDIGPHCFTYAMVLASEFSFDGENGADTLKLMEQRTDSWPTSDWHSPFLVKDEVKGEHRVTKKNFMEFFTAKFENELEVPIDASPEFDYGALVKKYENYLHKVFDVAWEIMKENPHYRTEQDDDPTLGEHCFRYAALLAGEFYFTPGVGNGGFHDSLGVTS